jgi:hypothetical protein
MAAGVDQARVQGGGGVEPQRICHGCGLKLSAWAVYLGFCGACLWELERPRTKLVSPSYGSQANN